MSAFDDLILELQKAPDIDAMNVIFHDVDHAKSSGQITQEEYLDLVAYAYNP